MDPIAITFTEFAKYGILGIALIWVYRESRDTRAKFDSKCDKMQERCDDERKALSEEIAAVRDAYAKDQREVLLAATTALADVAKTNRELVGIHERREGSGQHQTVKP